VEGLKFKPNSQNTLQFNSIIIIKILAQVVNIFSKTWQNKKYLIYAKTVHVLW
jgi:hypothetical protein